MRVFDSGRLITVMCVTVLTCVVSGAEIRNVIAKQRYPWNGKVDIAYTVTGDLAAGLPSDMNPVLLVSATNCEVGTSYAASVTALSGDTGTAEGVHHVVWDLNAQGLEFKSDDVVFTVAYATPQYCVIDLSRGANASSYPISYLSSIPFGGWSDEYKTTKLVLLLIEPGSFMMEGWCQVTLTKPFYCGVFEVTQRQWELVMGSNPCSTTSYGRGNSYPVHYVSYEMIRGSSNGAQWPTSSAVDSRSFIGKLRAKTGINGFDLPTEAQWEYACRAGTTTTYSYGDTANGDYMWYYNNSNSRSHLVGTMLPNQWGVYDMHGNVWEWCLDWLGDLTSGVVDPMGPSSGSRRVARGGSWKSYADSCPSSYRSGIIFLTDDGHSCGLYGFRLVRTLSD